MMSSINDIADSTDWLNTPLSGLAPLESGLRCQVCKDFFTTPMITSCSHTFCSLCIRRYLSQEGRCPACREQDQELKLRRNWTVEELVAYFTQARDSILAFASRPPPQPREPGTERPKKRRKVETITEDTERRSTRSQSRRYATSASQADQDLVSTQEEIADSEEEGSVYQDETGQSLRVQRSKPQPEKTEPHDGLVACPGCTRRMKENLINAHLDRCLAGIPSPELTPAAILPTSNGSASLSFVQRTKSPLTATDVPKDRLPSINYALLTDTSLRRKLKDLGIPFHGGKDAMRKRHTEWMNLWNAECDSRTPKTKKQLLRILETWERTVGRQVEKETTASAGRGASSSVMGKEFDRDGWAKSQKFEFDDLIRKAREKRQAKVVQNKTGEDVNMTDADEKKNAGAQEGDTGSQSHGDLLSDVVPTSEKSVSKGLEPVHTGFNGVDTESTRTLNIREPLMQGSNSIVDVLDSPPKRPILTALTENVVDLTSSPDVDVNTAERAQAEDDTPRKRSKFFS